MPWKNGRKVRVWNSSNEQMKRITWNSSKDQGRCRKHSITRVHFITVMCGLKYLPLFTIYWKSIQHKMFALFLAQSSKRQFMQHWLANSSIHDYIYSLLLLWAWSMSRKQGENNNSNNNNNNNNDNFQSDSQMSLSGKIDKGDIYIYTIYYVINGLVPNCPRSAIL